MANTYALIASNIVGSGGASSVTFSSISQTYTDLVVKVSSRTARSTGSAADQIAIAFNGSNTYTAKILNSGSPFGTPQSYSSSSLALETDSANNTANTFNSGEIYITNYTSTNNKSYSTDSVAENNSGSGDYLVALSLMAGSATLTSGITSITLTSTTSNNFVQYSSFYLYGIKNS